MMSLCFLPVSYHRGRISHSLRAGSTTSCRAITIMYRHFFCCCCCRYASSNDQLNRGQPWQRHRRYGHLVAHTYRFRVTLHRLRSLAAEEDQVEGSFLWPYIPPEKGVNLRLALSIPVKICFFVYLPMRALFIRFLLINDLGRTVGLLLSWSDLWRSG